MLHAVLKLVHLLSLVAWIGGMFFTLVCLRPALGVLDAPARPRLMSAVLRRFFAVVEVAIGLVLLTGLGLLWSARHGAGAGSGAGMPPSWTLMVVLGVAMMLVFAGLRAVLYPRLQAALRAQDGPAAAAVLARIRGWVLVNLVLGVLIVAAMALGAAVGL